MSAYIVSRHQITAMVDLASAPGRELNYYHNDQYHGPRYFTHDYDENGRNITWRDALGQMLIDANVDSVSHRYPDSKDGLPGPINAYYEMPYIWASTVLDPRTTPTPIEGIKVVRNFMYQSCERPDWEDSQAKAFCDALILDLIGKLPGYDAAPWGWEEENAHKNRQVSIMDMLNS